MFGTALPDMASKAVARTAPAQAAASQTALTDAPRFRPPLAAECRPSLPISGRPGALPEQPAAAPSQGIHPADVHCENGVCVRAADAPSRAETSLAVAVETPSAPIERPRPVLADADQLSHIQQRLRELGATYYLLETWGNSGEQYRFYCKVAVGGNASFCRYFEATNADPLQAMAQVLREVETWRESRG